MKAVTYVEVDTPNFGLATDEASGTLVYDFMQNSALSFTGTNATLTPALTGLLFEPSASDPDLRSPGSLTIDGSEDRYIRIDFERANTPTGEAWEGKVFYTTADHSFSTDYCKSFPVPSSTADGTRETLVIDMWDLDEGGDDWKDSEITQLRFDFTDGDTSDFTILSISVGAMKVNDREAVFDGTNDFLDRGGPLLNLSDGQQGTVSFWAYVEDGTGTHRILANATTVGGATDHFRVGVFEDKFFVVAYNSSSTIILDVLSDEIEYNQWYHCVASWDLSDPDGIHLYVNGVDDLTTLNTFTDDTIDYAGADWAIGAEADGNNKFEGIIADLWFDDSYIDLSVPGNVARFYSERGGPTNLGQFGQNPTGTSPLIYMTGAASTWHLNKGVGGNFNTNGELGETVVRVPETWRFCDDNGHRDLSIEAIPILKGVTVTPGKVSLGEDLGQRTSASATFRDTLFKFGNEDLSSGTFWGKWRGRYGQTLRNNAFRVIRGTADQPLSSMRTHHLFVDNTQGPEPKDGSYKITAKDAMKALDDSRAQAPVLSSGSLQGGIAADTTSATLSPSGIGDIEYPASGYLCLGGKEVVSFTRSGDTLTIVRGQLGSTAIAHDSGDRVQLCIRYDGNTVAEIINDLLTNYVDGITDDMIPLTEWTTESNSFLNVVYARTITEPTSVKELVSDFVEQAALALWWDETSQRIQLRVLREISTDSETFDEDRVIQDSLVVTEQPERRISRMWTYYGQRDPTDQADNRDNYRAALAEVDSTLEAEYGLPSIREIRGAWVSTITAAERLSQIQLSRFRNPPRAFKFSLWHDQDISLGLGYQVRYKANTDRFGNQLSVPIQITRINVQHDFVHVEAEEMLVTGEVVVTNTVFLTTTGSGTWTVPDSWNDSNNEIHCIGGGGSGAAEGSGKNGGKGGGGGAYSGITNLSLTPGASITYNVGAGGPGVGVNDQTGEDGGDTWFNGASLAASSCGAEGGNGGSGRTGNGTGGQASNGVGTVKYSGGNGGSGGTYDDESGGGGGGGGAAGPNGNGGNGGNNQQDDNGSGAGGGGADGGSTGNGVSGGSGSEDPGDGGNNRFNFGGGTSANPTGRQGGGGRGGGPASNPQPAGAGGTGEQLWTQTITPIISAGPGGGGGGGREQNGNFSGAGGLYGGGSGGGGSNGQTRDGAQGIIVITWQEAS